MSGGFDYNTSCADLTSIDSDRSNDGYLEPSTYGRSHNNMVSLDDFNRQYLDQPPLPISHHGDATLVNLTPSYMKPTAVDSAAKESKHKYLEMCNRHVVSSPRLNGSSTVPNGRRSRQVGD